MIIEPTANLSALAERLGDTATDGDAQTALDNLLEAGWKGWDSKDIPGEVFFGAAEGPVAGPAICSPERLTTRA